ncbi:unnamed protein product [Microthlaspi erraticum]|uniref:Uncharacterized protein n=1 Tax=Microthlaspi erraticum TaxID=1685480 RepID=A0A6D2JP38_9BRAS|nr:unnamed protein product [Microthlaspi erraticum]
MYSLPKLHDYAIAIGAFASADNQADNGNNPSVFLYNTLISSIVSNHQSTQTHLAFSLYARILTSRSAAIRPIQFTYPSLFKDSGFQPSVASPWKSSSCPCFEIHRTS